MKPTRKEALQILKSRDSFGIPTGYAGGIREAIDMGTDALEKIEKIEQILQSSSFEENGKIYSYAYTPEMKVKLIAKVINHE